MPSIVYSAPSKYALTLAWLTFGLSSIVTLISAARLPADGACWTWGCMSFMLPALALMFTSVHYLNRLSGNNLMYSAHKCAQTSAITEDSIIAYINDLHNVMNTFTPLLEAQQDSLNTINDILHRYYYPLSQPVLRAQLFVFTDAAQAKQIIDNISRSERLLNRTWSALSDGYEQEALAAYAEARGICEDVLTQLSQP